MSCGGWVLVLFFRSQVMITGHYGVSAFTLPGFSSELECKEAKSKFAGGVFSNLDVKAYCVEVK